MNNANSARRRATLVFALKDFSISINLWYLAWRITARTGSPPYAFQGLAARAIGGTGRSGDVPNPNGDQDEPRRDQRDEQPLQQADQWALGLHEGGGITRRGKQGRPSRQRAPTRVAAEGPGKEKHSRDDAEEAYQRRDAVDETCRGLRPDIGLGVDPVGWKDACENGADPYNEECACEAAPGRQGELPDDECQSEARSLRSEKPLSGGRHSSQSASR